LEGGKERRNGGRVIGGRGKMRRSTVGGESGRMVRGRGTDVHVREGGGQSEGKVFKVRPRMEFFFLALTPLR